MDVLMIPIFILMFTSVGYIRIRREMLNIIMCVSNGNDSSFCFLLSTKLAAAIKETVFGTVLGFGTFQELLLCGTNKHLTTPGGNKMCVLIYTYAHKPLREIKVAICNHQVDCLFHWVPSLIWCFASTQEYNDIVHDAECLY